jgi:MoaA/NifB/PqqE/SkfB family radical SAM enzyme
MHYHGGTMSKICSLPFNHLASHPNGSVSLCCQADMNNQDSFARTNGKMLFLGKDSLDTIRNSDSFKQVRLDMLAGKEPEQCRRCYETERSGGISKRQYENKNFNWNDDDAFTYVDGSIDSDLQFIELRLGNTCNLACVTCNGVSSSKWIKDEKELAKKIEWFKPFENNKQTRWFESEEFYEHLGSISKHVKKIYINGGEPMLIKQHKVLLKKLIELGVSKNIRLEYSINLTIQDQEFLDLWQEFEFVMVQVSIDALWELNDWIRYGSKFTEIKKTLEWLVKNRPFNTHIMGCQTISAINACKISDMEEFLSGYGIDSTVNPVYSPDFFSASALTEAEKIKVRKSLVHVKNANSVKVINAWLDTHDTDYSMRDKLNEFVKNVDSIRTIKYPKFMGDIVIGK